MDVKIIDDFLPPYEFNKIKTNMMGAETPWFFNPGTAHSDDGRYQFTHTYFQSSWGGVWSEYYKLFDPVQELLKVDHLERIKANLNPKTVEREITGYHIDFIDMKTSVYYINTNNGGTQFKGGDFVQSVENRMVVFDSNFIHAGVTCTDEQRRVLVNFNYTEKRG